MYIKLPIMKGKWVGTPGLVLEILREAVPPTCIYVGLRLPTEQLDTTAVPENPNYSSYT